MTFKLKRVELSNMRSHKHTIFEPEDTGVTALRGSNGAGKSTIVDSIAWALYGTKPSGVSKVIALFREGAEFGKDRCFVIVDFEVDSKTYRVERRMVTKGGAVECEVWEIIKKEPAEDEDGESEETLKQVAGPAVSHVKNYINKLLKMDEKGFLAAVLVQQKEVDNLISAPPGERAKVIEKLTGISPITAALENASKEYSSLKKVATLSTIDETELEKLKVNKASLDITIENSKKTILSLRDSALAAREEVKGLSETVEIESEKFEKSEKLRETITVLKVRIESSENELERLTVDRKEKKSQLSLVASGVSLEELEPKVAKLKSDLRREELDQSKLDSKLTQLKSELASLRKIISESNEKSDEAESTLEIDSKRILEISSEVLKMQNEEVSAVADIKKIKKAISALTKGNGECPTCLQAVDDVSVAVETLKKEITSLEEKNSAIQLKLGELSDEKSGLTVNTARLSSLINAYGQVEDINANMKSTSAELDSKTSIVKVSEGELNAVERVYNEAKRKHETKRDYDRLLDRSKKLSNEISEFNLKKDKAEDLVKNSGTITTSALSRLRKKLDIARNKSSELSMEFSEAKGDMKLSQERFSSLSDKIERGEKDVSKYKDLLKSVEIASSSKQLIEKFREERISNSIPVIEVYASDLLSRFTEGNFTQLKLDAKFNATVRLSNGNERPVSLLSGGELSATSMALRLAISMLLNSGTASNLIILDEVLVSQDISRADLILSTIKEVCRGQVILIAHSDSIDSVADRVVELTPSISSV